MVWENQLFIDSSLPFGLRSAPKIFCCVSDTLESIFKEQGVSSCLHYIDDFLTMASSKEECDQNLALILQICEALGVPLAVKKLEGPTTVIISLELN